MVDFVEGFSLRTEGPVWWVIHRLGLHPRQYYRWEVRYGSENRHNGRIPRDHWLENWEEEAILDFHERNPLEGYRRLTFMMLDQNVVAVSPATVYRVLK